MERAGRVRHVGPGVHPNWPDRFFAKITDGYLTRAGNRGGFVGKAQSYLFLMRDLLTFALGIMRSVAADTRAADRLEEPRV